MKPSEVSDTQLVISIGRFEEDALAEVYRRHVGVILGLARRVLGDGHHAEDVTQDVFVRLWSHPERFDPGRGSLRSFLLTMAHGRAVDVARSNTARREREAKVTDLSALTGADVEPRVWELSQVDRVHEAMAELSFDERRAIELAYFDGHSYREVARILSEPEGTIKSRIRSGLQRMRTSLTAGGLLG